MSVGEALQVQADAHAVRGARAPIEYNCSTSAMAFPMVCPPRYPARGWRGSGRRQRPHRPRQGGLGLDPLFDRAEDAVAVAIQHSDADHVARSP